MRYICRTCLLDDNEEMESIYSLKLVNNEDISLSEMITLCVGLEISEYEHLTTFICKSCVSILTEAFKYRKRCWESHNSLLQQIKQQKEVKIENLDVFEFTSMKEGDIFCEFVDNFESIVTCNEIVTSAVEKDETLARENSNRQDEPVASDDLVKIDLSIVRNEPITKHESNTIIKPVVSDTDNPLPKVNPPKWQKLSDHAEVILDKTCYLGKRYSCRTCQRVFMRRDRIIGHLRTEHNIIISIPNGCSCPKCFKIFESRSILKVHVESVHNPISLICDVCGATLKSKFTFKQHKLTHTGEKPYKCKLCDFRTAHNGSIIAHQRRVHTGERPFKCHVCGDGFISAGRRTNHMAKHSEPQFECIVCHKKFSSRSQYQKHIVIHDLTKYVACDLCDKKFSKRSNMVTHRKQHTGEKNHTCNECGKGFIQRHCWRTHMKNHHGQIVL